MGRHHNQDLSPEDRRPLDRKLTKEGALTLVLFRPRIPQNTGSIARLCAATGSRLDLVAPLFKIDDKKLRRAGLDYWHLLDVCLFDSEADWFNKRKPQDNFHLVELSAPRPYTEASFKKSDYIILGDEEIGIKPEILEKHSDKHIDLPQEGVRSLNLAMCAGIVCYEALRQIHCKR